MSFVFAVPVIGGNRFQPASGGAERSHAAPTWYWPRPPVGVGGHRVFSAHGQEFQALSAQASAFHDRFIAGPKRRSGLYVDAEAANAALVDTAATGASELNSIRRTAGSTPEPATALRLRHSRSTTRHHAPHY